MVNSLTRILSLILSFCLILEQSVFAQTIDLSHYFARNSASAIPQSDKFRPLHLRYIAYDNQANDFKILLDKGDIVGNGRDRSLQEETQELMKYFLIGLALPNDKFWVNLRPDYPDNILDPDLEKTDIGRIFLEADLQLKKDTAGMTSPQNPQGKEYWDKLYKKAGELFGTENITIPTITRPWIVPNEIIIRESPEGAYIYKATLKVMLEEDYLTSRGGGSRTALTSGQNAFSDPRLKELNEYSTQLIKETIIPKLTYEVNASKRYAPLRQVYYSLILAQWFKQKYGLGAPVSGLRSEVNSYIKLIDSGDLAHITLSQPYDKQTYFRQYQKSFQDGEYSLQEPVYTPMGQSIRRYVSGGTLLNCSSAIEAGKIKGKQLSLPFHNPQYLIPDSTRLSGTTSSSILPLVINTSTNLQQLPFEEMGYKNPEEFLEKIKEFVQKKQDASIVRGLIGGKLNHDPGKTRVSLDMVEQLLIIEIQKLISQREFVVTPFHPEQLNEGDIVLMPKGRIGVYVGSKSANSRPYLLPESTGKETWGEKWPQMKALTEKQIVEWKPLTMYLFDSLGSSYSGRTIREEDYGEYRIIRARSVIDIKNTRSSGNVSSSIMPVMVKYFISKLHSLGANINGIEEIKSEAIVSDSINDLQWYIYAMPDNRYLELFINKDNDAIAYGVITFMPQNTVLRFHSFTKNAGRGDYWADVYRQRMDKLKRIFPSMSVIAIPTDQVISEDQLAKRIGEYIKKYDGQNLSQSMLIIANIIKAIRSGAELTEDQIKMATYSGFEGFYSFGPAANFYVNKLGFSLVPTGVAIHKHTISKEEQNLLDKLKVGRSLEESEIIKLFSGRGLVKRVSSSPANTAASSAVEWVDKSQRNQETEEILRRIRFITKFPRKIFLYINKIDKPQTALVDSRSLPHLRALGVDNANSNDGLIQLPINFSSLPEEEKTAILIGELIKLIYPASYGARMVEDTLEDNGLIHPFRYCWAIAKLIGDGYIEEANKYVNYLISVYRNAYKEIGARQINDSAKIIVVKDFFATYLMCVLPFKLRGYPEYVNDNLIKIVNSFGEHFGAVLNNNVLDGLISYIEKIAVPLMGNDNIYPDIFTFEKINKHINGVVKSSSSLNVDEEGSVIDDKGGIAFNALPIQTQMMPEVSSALTSNLKPLTSAELDVEWAQIQAMVNAAIRPAPDRLERYAVSVSSSLKYSEQRDKFVGLLADILRNDETSQRQPRLEPALRNILLALESE